eukprot:353423-Chlamydomonas_euryale.AAC.3
MVAGVAPCGRVRGAVAAEAETTAAAAAGAAAATAYWRFGRGVGEGSGELWHPRDTPAPTVPAVEETDGLNETDARRKQTLGRRAPARVARSAQRRSQRSRRPPYPRIPRCRRVRRCTLRS